MKRMNKDIIFRTLGIEETTDETLLKQAYRTILKETNPEDHPEEFKKLRQAYEEALLLATKSKSVSLQQEENKEEQSPVAKWMEKIDSHYKDMEQRKNPTVWKILLEDEVCEDLDTCLDAERTLLSYLMEHIYLPKQIWTLIDQRFHFRENLDALKEQYPLEFLKYMKSSIEEEDKLEYDFFQVLNKEEQDGDGYIREYYEIRSLVDQKEYQDAEEKIKELSFFGLYHPYEDVEKVRIHLGKREHTQGSVLAEKLFKKYPFDLYVLFYVSKAREVNGDKEGAKQLWEKLKEREPKHYGATIGLVNFLIEEEKYLDAQKMIMDFIEDSGNSEEIGELLNKVNEALILQYQETLPTLEKNSEEWERVNIELAWCLYQNQKPEEALQILDTFEPQEENYSYMNLKGRAALSSKEYERASVLLRKWHNYLVNIKDDDTKEVKQRKNRLSLAYYLLGICSSNLKEYQEAETFLKNAIEVETNHWQRLEEMLHLSSLYITEKKFEKVVDTCDEMIQIEKNFYPALLNRQQAFFELKRGQEVVNDYYKAIELYSGYYKPYFLAAQVFYYYDQYEDSDAVLKKAQENKVEFSDAMKLLEVKLSRCKEGNSKIWMTGIKACMKLKERLGMEESDIEDASDLESEIGILYWNLNKNDVALHYMGNAIELNDKKGQYHYIKGRILVEMEHYNSARESFENQAKLEASHYGYYYWGLCLEKLEKVEEAALKYEKAL